MTPNSLLWMAVRREGVKEIRGALKLGANVDSRDMHFWTPLMCVSDHSWVESQEEHAPQDFHSKMKVLIELGANVNAVDPQGTTPVMISVWGLQPNTLALLLASGADVDARDEKQRTAALWAIQYESESCLALLAQYGACLETDYIDGESLIDIARQKQWVSVVSVWENLQIKKMDLPCTHHDNGFGL